MAKITAIKKQEKRERVSIFVDAKYSFSLSLNQLVDYSLKKNQEITNADIAKYKKLSDFGKHLENAIAWCLRRPHSEKEFDQYIYKKQLDKNEAEQIKDYLIKNTYLSNTAFTKFWIENRSRSKKPSKRSLISELRSKGVDNSTIEEELSLASFNEDEMLRELIAKKSKLSQYKDKQKLKQYLARQGFSYDLINNQLSK